MVRRLLGQFSTGPSLVLDQSVERMSAPISPPPANRSLAGAALELAVGCFVLLSVMRGPQSAIERDPGEPGSADHSCIESDARQGGHGVSRLGFPPLDRSACTRHGSINVLHTTPSPTL